MIKILLLLTLFGCATKQIPKQEVPKVPDVVNPTPNPGHIGEATEYTDPVKPIEQVEKIFTTSITTENCSESHKAKIRDAETIIRRVYNSQEFKDAILNHTFNGKKAFNWPNELSNQEIYDHMFGGAEALRPTLNYQMDLTIVCYTNNYVRTIGYTYPNQNKVWANMKYHAGYSAVEVASNSAHEHSHKMGFGHSVDWNKERNFTVPYAINTIIEKLAKVKELTPIREVQ